MAHVAHFKINDIKRLRNEYQRDEKYVCRDGRIDSTRTNLNYNFKPDDLNQAFEKRFAEVKHSNRKDLNVISDWVVTCPQELIGTSQQSEFFELTYEFIKARYGANNVLQGYVHLDESTPHMHIPVIPVKDDRVSSKALFTKSELSNFHKDLDKAVENEFGLPGLVLNGRTKGNYTIQELKERTSQEQALYQQQQDADIELYALIQRETRLKAQIDVLNEERKEFTLYKEKWQEKANKSLQALRDKLESTAKANYEKQVQAVNDWADAYKKQLDEDFQRRQDNLEAIFKEKVDEAVKRRMDAEQRYAYQNESQGSHRELPDISNVKF